MNTEKNKLIAEFMGLNKKINLTGDYYSWCDSPFYYTAEKTKEKVIENIAYYAKYHSDWNWLMEVVEKIESKGFTFEIKKNWARITKKGGNIVLRWEDDKTKIEAVYNACIEFIKWYSVS